LRSTRALSKSQSQQNKIYQLQLIKIYLKIKQIMKSKTEFIVQILSNKLDN